MGLLIYCLIKWFALYADDMAGEKDGVGENQDEKPQECFTLESEVQK
jgi:hypothetical protein